MVKGLYTASTGMVNEQRRVDILSNNLANVSTAGYKKEGTTSEAFSDVLALKIKDTSEPMAARRLGTMNMGVKIGEVYTDYSQGSFQETGNTFDLAISGNGFFAVDFTDKQGNGMVKYTRDGNFTLNVDGDLVNKNGDYVLDAQGNHISLDPLHPADIDRTGTIRQNGAVVAQIQVTDFTDYDYLEKYGENYYTLLQGGEEIESEAQVYSGYIETSNVQAVQEMVSLITYQRAYETNQKMIQAFDETLDTAVNNVGKV